MSALSEALAQAQEKLELRWIERDERGDETEHRDTWVFWHEEAVDKFMSWTFLPVNDR